MPMSRLFTVVVAAAVPVVGAGHAAAQVVTAPPGAPPFEFQADAQTGNQRSVTRGLTGLDFTQPLPVELIQTLNADAPPVTRAALNSLSGENYATQATVTSSTGEQSVDVVLGRLGQFRSVAPAATAVGFVAFDREDSPWRPGEAADYATLVSFQPGGVAGEPVSPGGTAALVGDEVSGGLWVRGFGSWGDIESDTEFGGADYNSGGIALGLDRQFADNLLIGASIAYARTDIDHDRTDAGDEADSYNATLYATYLPGGEAWIDMLVGYTFVQHDIERTSALGQSATADYDAHIITAMIEAGYSFDLAERGRVQFQPLASLTYSGVWQDGFREDGAGPLNLVVDDSETHSLLGGVGGRLLARLRPSENLLVVPEVRAGYSVEFANDNATIAARFEGAAAGSSFGIQGADLGRDAGLVGAGVTLHTDRNLSVFAGYDATLAEDFTIHTVTGGLRFAW